MQQRTRNCSYLVTSMITTHWKNIQHFWRVGSTKKLKLKNGYVSILNQRYNGKLEYEKNTKMSSFSCIKENIQE